MNMSVNVHEFYYEASNRILGTMVFEKSMQDLLIYLKNYMPGNHLSLHIFDAGLGIIETIIDATLQKSELISKISTLSQQARILIQESLKRPSPYCMTIEKLSKNEMTRQLGLDFEAPNEPCIVMDLRMDGEFIGFISLSSSEGQMYNEDHVRLLEAIHDPLAIASSQFKKNRDVNRLKDIVSEDARLLQERLMQKIGDKVVGSEFGLKTVMEQVEKVASLDSSVLLLGETGVGKELIAWALHRMSPRSQQAFIKINCGSIPSTLIDSELFGYEKGAFTGAFEQHRGCFERADNGTILLDEIGELTPESQVRLLRVLQEGIIKRVGGSREIDVNVRILAATNKNLEEMVENGTFRMDLFYRLNVFPIVIPPLRERRFDIPSLTHHLIGKKIKQMGLPELPEIKDGAIDNLTKYDWPGNVRELENIIEREIILHPNGPLSFDIFINSLNLQNNGTSVNHNEAELDKVITNHITSILRKTGGKVEGTGGAAELLNVNPRTLQYRMKKLEIPFGRNAKNLYC